MADFKQIDFKFISAVQDYYSLSRLLEKKDKEIEHLRRSVGSREGWKTRKNKKS